MSQQERCEAPKWQLGSLSQQPAVLARACFSKISRSASASLKVLSLCQERQKILTDESVPSPMSTGPGLRGDPIILEDGSL